MQRLKSELNSAPSRVPGMALSLVSQSFYIQEDKQCFSGPNQSTEPRGKSPASWLACRESPDRKVLVPPDSSISHCLLPSNHSLLWWQRLLCLCPSQSLFLCLCPLVLLFLFVSLFLILDGGTAVQVCSIILGRFLCVLWGKGPKLR